MIISENIQVMLNFCPTVYMMSCIKVYKELFKGFILLSLNHNVSRETWNNALTRRDCFNMGKRHANRTIIG